MQFFNRFNWWLIVTLTVRVFLSWHLWYHKIVGVPKARTGVHHQWLTLIQVFIWNTPEDQISSQNPEFSLWTSWLVSQKFSPSFYLVSLTQSISVEICSFFLLTIFSLLHNKLCLLMTHLLSSIYTLYKFYHE